MDKRINVLIEKQLNIVKNRINHNVIQEEEQQFTGETVDNQSMDSEMVNDSFTDTSDGTTELDVTDLVKNSEENKAKIDNVISTMNTKFDELIKSFSSIKQSMSSEIDNVKQSLSDEIQKTHPTPEHKLVMRSLDANPFSVSTHEYWEEEKADNYKLIKEPLKKSEDMDNYTVTNVELDNSYVETDVAASFFKFMPY